MLNLNTHLPNGYSVCTIELDPQSAPKKYSTMVFSGDSVGIVDYVAFERTEYATLTAALVGHTDAVDDWSIMPQRIMTASELEEQN